MLSPGIRLGPYEILAPIGAGGMGEVFRARDTRLGRDVAVKILPEALAADPHRVARFETEARALAALSHPNILGIHDFGRSDGRIYAVTELLEGESLRDRMAGEQVPWRKAAEIAASIADALASAHAAGIVHRDLKPENVFVTSDGRVKVLDFGLVKFVEPVVEDAVTLTSPSPRALSADGEVVGTLSYMAPEQLRGFRVDGRTDIFALGCVLFELLSAKRPFDGASQADTISAILRAEPPSLDVAGSGIPMALALVVSRCLEKRPEDRFDTAHDLALALRGVPAGLRPAAAPQEETPPVGHLRLARAGLVAAGTALLIFAATIFLGRPRTHAKSANEHAAWGPPRQITSAPGWEAEPAFSPDGTLVAYSSAASGNPEVWVVDPEGGEPLRLTDGPGENRKPAWFPDGRSIAFASTRTGVVSVRRVPRLGGSSSLLVEQADMPAISPDGTRVAFTRRGPSGLPRIWVAPLADPSGARRLTGDADGEWEHMDPAWSPDGTLLCYSSFRDLWLVPADQGDARRLTHDGHADREPVFSADGSFVFFSSTRTNPQAVWRISVAGGEPERMTPGSGVANHPSFPRDGRRLVYSSLVVDRDVLVADRQTGAVSRISSSRDDEMPAMAPDGSAVAFCSNRVGAEDLWLAALEAGRAAKRPPIRLTTLDPGVATPAFSGDGQWIAFFRPFKGHRDLWTVPLTGGTPRALVEGGGDNIHPAYSPDGTRLAFVSDRSGHEQVWVLPMRSEQPAGEPWRLTSGDVTDAFPAWSRDGARIAFIRDDEAWEVQARPGAAPRRVTSGAGAHVLAWEPGGEALVVSGLFGTGDLHVREVKISSGVTKPLSPPLVLGDRDAVGYISLSRDGRFLAADVTEHKGNLWITSASRDGR